MQHTFSRIYNSSDGRDNSLSYAPHNHTLKRNISMAIIIFFFCLYSCFIWIDLDKGINVNTMKLIQFVAPPLCIMTVNRFGSNVRQTTNTVYGWAVLDEANCSINSIVAYTFGSMVSWQRLFNWADVDVMADKTDFSMLAIIRISHQLCMWKELEPGCKFTW